MKMSVKSLVSALFVVATLAVAAPAHADDAVHFIGVGPRGGLQIHDETKAFIGAEGRFGLLQLVPSVRLDLRPFFDYYFISDVTVFDIGADALFAFDIHQDMFEPYAGAGLNVGHYSVSVGSASASDTSVGLDLLGGVNFLPKERLRPFVEFRLSIGGDWKPYDLTGGLIFLLN
jgi:opacity protein-like surface antigen